MPDLAVAGLDTPAQRVRHGARMAVVPERIPAAGRGLRRSWRCALLGEHWRPSYLAERDLWLCVPASRRVCPFQSLGVVPFGQYAHELLPFEGNWTLVRRVAVWPVNPISSGIVSGGPPRVPRTAGRLLRYPSEHLAAHRPRAWFGRIAVALPQGTFPNTRPGECSLAAATTERHPARHSDTVGRARVRGSGGTGVRPSGALPRSGRPSVRPPAAVPPCSPGRIRRPPIYQLCDEFGPRAETLLIDDP